MFGVAMGGYGSGRSGAPPTVEDSFTLDLRRLFKAGWLKPGQRTSGTVRWTKVNTDRAIACIHFKSNLGISAVINREHTASSRNIAGGMYQRAHVALSHEAIVRRNHAIANNLRLLIELVNVDD